MYTYHEKLIGIEVNENCAFPELYRVAEEFDLANMEISPDTVEEIIVSIQEEDGDFEGMNEVFMILRFVANEDELEFHSAYHGSADTQMCIRHVTLTNACKYQMNQLGDYTVSPSMLRKDIENSEIMIDLVRSTVNLHPDVKAKLLPYTGLVFMSVSS